MSMNEEWIEDSITCYAFKYSKLKAKKYPPPKKQRIIHFKKTERERIYHHLFLEKGVTAIL